MSAVFCRHRARWLLLVLLAPTAWGTHPAGGRAAETADQALVRAASAGYADIRTATLANGLRVYLKPVKGAPVVTTMVAYKGGSAAGGRELHGRGPCLEHLMCEGHAKIKPGDIDRLTQRNGGRNNAFTTEDYTIFHFDFAADRYKVAFKVEADRMRNLRIDKEHEFEQEKGAVIEELQRDEDEPWDLE